MSQDKKPTSDPLAQRIFEPGEQFPQRDQLKAALRAGDMKQVKEIIGMTPEGRLLNEELALRGGHFSEKQHREIWESASARFAEQTRGQEALSYTQDARTVTKSGEPSIYHGIENERLAKQIEKGELKRHYSVYDPYASPSGGATPAKPAPSPAATISPSTPTSNPSAPAPKARIPAPIPAAGNTKGPKMKM